MCGIAGAIGLNPERARAAIANMRAALRHRGPDAERSAVVRMPSGPPVALAHTRLAIIDLSPLGEQPMFDAPDGRGEGEGALAIVFNGEIFNFETLRAELEQRGERFRSRSDTEVILKAWRAYGRGCVDRLRGMFAICLVDPRERTVWLCRDRFGIKPLYTFRPESGGLLFASEVRALLAAGDDLVPRRLDPVALESYLARGAVSGERAIVAGVRMLPPGTDLLLDAEGRELSSRRYWKLPVADAAGSPKRDDVVADLAETLRDAVRMRLISDVPLGAFLSSGVDSASVVTLAKEVSASDIRTLTIGFDAQAYDESPEAAEIARSVGTNHSALQLSGEDVLRDIDQVFAAMDQPTVDGFNTYFVSRAARSSGLTVALSGLGGDELFGGYTTFKRVPLILQRQRALRLLGPFGRVVPWALNRRRGGQAGQRTYERYVRPSDALNAYMLFRETFLPRTRRALMSLPPGSEPITGLPASYQERLAEDLVGASVENRVSLLESDVYMGQMLLRDSDVFSMAVGLELRVPLLDHVVAEKVARLPGSWKLPVPWPKSLLIDAVGRRLPSSTYAGAKIKRGFTFPWRVWLRGPLRERARDACHDEQTWRSLGIRPAEPQRLFRLFDAGGPACPVTETQMMCLWVLREHAARHRLSP